MSVFVGGVGELYQGDLDVGRRVVEALAGERLGPDVLVEELHYGAIAVAQRLAEVAPAALVLVGAAERGRAPGTIVRRRVRAEAPPVDEFQEAIREAGTGYVSIDLLVTVCAGLEALPSRTVVVEMEPAAARGPVDVLSAIAEGALPEAVWQVRAEAGRIPLLELSERITPLVVDGRLGPAPAVDVIRRLLAELGGLDADGRWGSAFALRDRLRQTIAEGGTSEGMEHEDWALWWALIEELDRLQAAEALGP